MGIRFSCPNGHKLHVKEILAGKRAICPTCGTKLTVPTAAESAVEAPLELAAGEPPPPFAETPSIVIPVIEASPPLATGLPAASPAVAVPLRDFSVPASPLLSSFTTQRRNKRRTQTNVAVILLVIVLVLLAVLIFVLSRGASDDEPAETPAATHVAPYQSPHYAAHEAVRSIASRNAG